MTMNEPKTKRTVKEPEIRRQEIVATATELFLAQGYEETSTTDVMKALNIAKGTIYHYFPSKEKILEAVVDQLVGDYVQRRKLAVASSKGNALVKIQVLFSPDDHPQEADQTLEHLHKQSNIRLHTRLLAVLIEELAPVFSDLIKQGCEEGLLETEHPDEVAELLLAGIQFLTDQGIFPWTDDVIQRRNSTYPVIMESLLKARPGAFHWLNRERHRTPPAEQGE
jgi:AcrR family transcriptional regulator